MKKIIALLLALVLCLSLVACGGSSSSKNSSSKSNSSSKKGFVGSDGKYHKYNPAYSDEVNDWMRDNW